MKIIFRGDEVKLVVVSDDKSGRLSCGLSRLLSKHGGVLLFGNNTIIKNYIDTPEYLIADSDVKFGGNFKNAISVEISKSGDVFNETLIYKVPTGEVQKLRIGTDFKDDITLSSRNYNEISFGIQSVIIDLCGKYIYPCEIKSKIANVADIHTLLTAAGILLISGEYHESSGFLNI